MAGLILRKPANKKDSEFVVTVILLASPKDMILEKDFSKGHGSICYPLSILMALLSFILTVARMRYMGGCQNYGQFWVLNTIRHPIFQGP